MAYQRHLPFPSSSSLTKLCLGSVFAFWVCFYTSRHQNQRYTNWYLTGDSNVPLYAYLCVIGGNVMSNTLTSFTLIGCIRSHASLFSRYLTTYVAPLSAAPMPQTLELDLRMVQQLPLHQQQYQQQHLLPCLSVHHHLLP